MFFILPHRQGIPFSGSTIFTLSPASLPPRYLSVTQWDRGFSCGSYHVFRMEDVLLPISRPPFKTHVRAHFSDTPKEEEEETSDRCLHAQSLTFFSFKRAERKRADFEFHGYSDTRPREYSIDERIMIHVLIKLGVLETGKTYFGTRVYRFLVLNYSQVVYFRVVTKS